MRYKNLVQLKLFIIAHNMKKKHFIDTILSYFIENTLQFYVVSINNRAGSM